MLESFICESLQVSLEWQQAAHRHAHDQPARFSLTLDKEDIFATNTIKVELFRDTYYKLSNLEKEKFEAEMHQRHGFKQLINHYHDISFLYAENRDFTVYLLSKS
ncbi:hypothetical protein RW115_12560 [Macrococcus capreoli]